MRFKKALIGALLLVLFALGVLFFASGMVAEKAASQWLKQKHIAFKELSIRHATKDGVYINSLTLGSGDNITLRNADILYVLKGKTPELREIIAEQVTLDIALDKGKFALGGVESLLPIQTSGGALTARLQLTGRLDARINGASVQGTLSDAKLTYTQGELSLSAQIDAITLEPTDAQGAVGFAIKAHALVISHADEPMTTPLQLRLTGVHEGTKITATGTLEDEKKTFPLALDASYNMKKSSGKVTWKTPSLSFVEGGLQPSVLSPLMESLPSLDATLQLDGSLRLREGKPPTLAQDIIITRAALSPLLKLMFKDDISITGDLAGRIPIRWAGEKAAQIKGATLTNLSSGTLIYDPLTGASTALEGQGQAALLLDALRKFSYDSLSVAASSDALGVLTSTFNIKGNNPEFFAGRPVDFTLNVNGNVLSLLETNRKVNDIVEQQ